MLQKFQKEKYAFFFSEEVASEIGVSGL